MKKQLDETPKRPDLNLGTTAHYADPTYYDRTYKRHRADITFYLQTILEQNGPVLELGCGTGRITLPVARLGIDIVGVDSSEAMLEKARSKLATQSQPVRNHVEFQCQDIRNMDLKKKFRVVISPFNVLQHLYTRPDLEGCFNVVKKHMMPRAGRFVFDVLVPDVRALGRSSARKYKLGKAYHPRGEKRYLYRESFDYDPISHIQYITMYFEDPDDPSGSFEVPLCHRQFFPVEMEALLHYNGFEIIDVFGDFDRSPLDEDKDTHIYVCKLGSAKKTFVFSRNPR